MKDVYHFQIFPTTLHVRFVQLLLIPLVIIVIALEPPVTIFALFVVYAASGPTAWLWHRRRAKRPESVTQQ